IRWVKETLPPRERARWLLMTTRLSASSLAGTARTLVAVGTVSEAFMFLTTLAAAPRSGVRLSPSWPAGVFGAGLAAAGSAAGFGAGAARGGRGAARGGRGAARGDRRAARGGRGAARGGRAGRRPGHLLRRGGGG